MEVSPKSLRTRVLRKAGEGSKGLRTFEADCLAAERSGTEQRDRPDLLGCRTVPRQGGWLDAACFYLLLAVRHYRHGMADAWLKAKRIASTLRNRDKARLQSKLKSAFSCSLGKIPHMNLKAER